MVSLFAAMQRTPYELKTIRRELATRPGRLRPGLLVELFHADELLRLAGPSPT